MKRETLFEAIGLADDELLEQSEASPPSTHWARWAAAAACLCLLVGLGFAARSLLFSGSTTASGSDGASGGACPEAAGDAAPGDAAPFMSYAGPILPLTAEAEGIAANRELILDFSPFAPVVKTGAAGETESYVSFRTDALVCDRYTLTNTGDTDLTTALRYPFISSLAELWKLRPTLTVDGAQAGEVLSVASYAGGFTGAGGSENDGESWNWKEFQTWEEYAALLEENGCAGAAFAGGAALNQPVVVYEFTGSYAPEDAGRAATLAMSFYLEEGLQVLTYRVNGMEWDTETGFCRYSYFVDSAQNTQGPILLAVLGGDIGDYDLRGYQDGGCDREAPGVTAAVLRRETTLGELLQTVTSDALARYSRDTVEMYGPETAPAAEIAALLYRSAAELLLSHSPLADDPKDRYFHGQLEELVMDALYQSQVFCLSAEAAIPAGGIVTVEARSVKAASFDFGGSGSDRAGQYGFDLLTAAGSRLEFSGVSLTLDTAGAVTVLEQDWDGGALSAILDPKIPHYALVVERTPSE